MKVVNQREIVFQKALSLGKTTSKRLTIWRLPHIKTITVLLYQNYSTLKRFKNLNALFCKRQQNNFWYRKYNYRTRLKNPHRFSTQFRLSGAVDRATTYCLLLHYIICLGGLLRQQIFPKTSELFYYFHIVKKYARYNNIQLLPSYEVNIESCQPKRYCFS